MNSSIINNYIYKKDENGHIISGGYPINHFIENELYKQNMLGGSIEPVDIGKERFKDLSIPIGLVSYSGIEKQTGGYQYSKSAQSKSANSIPVIENDQYNKLFSNVTKASSSSKNKHTRKITKR